MAIESLFSGMRISSSGYTAQRKLMDIIANNIANANSTRSAEGGPYKRMDAVLAPKVDSETGSEEGVEISKVFTDPSAPRLVYDPGHPDANGDGYVQFPNVSIIREMANMIQVSRAYEANITAMSAAKEMISKSFEIANV